MAMAYMSESALNDVEIVRGFFETFTNEMIADDVERTGGASSRCVEKKCGGTPRPSSRKVQSLQANTGFYGTELHPTSSSDRAVIQPVSCPIGCVMKVRPMRQRSIKDYH